MVHAAPVCFVRFVSVLRPSYKTCFLMIRCSERIPRTNLTFQNPCFNHGQTTFHRCADKVCKSMTLHIYIYIYICIYVWLTTLSCTLSTKMVFNWLDMCCCTFTYAYTINSMSQMFIVTCLSAMLSMYIHSHAYLVQHYKKHLYDILLIAAKLTAQVWFAICI